jgi:hypothetical protein
MSKHHIEDYKLYAVLYYLPHDKNLRDTCKIFSYKYMKNKVVLNEKILRIYK